MPATGSASGLCPSRPHLKGQHVATGEGALGSRQLAVLSVLPVLSPRCPAPVALTAAVCLAGSRAAGLAGRSLPRPRCRLRAVALPARTRLLSGPPAPHRPQDRLLPRAPAGYCHWARVAVCVTCGLQTPDGRLCRAASADRKACLTWGWELSARPGCTPRTPRSCEACVQLCPACPYVVCDGRSWPLGQRRCCCCCLRGDLPASGFLPEWGRRGASHVHSCAPCPMCRTPHMPHLVRLSGFVRTELFPGLGLWSRCCVRARG